jgi:uncharacterized protein (DUF2147 family)
MGMPAASSISTWLMQPATRSVAHDSQDAAPATPAADPQHGYSIGKHGRNWYVLDPAGELVCLTVYKRGAEEVVRRLAV